MEDEQEPTDVGPLDISADALEELRRLVAAGDTLRWASAWIQQDGARLSERLSDLQGEFEPLCTENPAPDEPPTTPCGRPPKGKR